MQSLIPSSPPNGGQPDTCKRVRDVGHAYTHFPSINKNEAEPHFILNSLTYADV